MKIALITLAVIAGLLLLVVAIGYALPVKHTASASAVYRATPESVFATITDLAGRSSWRRNLKAVESVPSSDGKTRFREVSSDGTIAYVVETFEPNRRVVARIDDPSLPFGGTWTWEVSPESEGRTRLTITENGEVYDPVFRFVSRFVMGYEATMKQYLEDLGKKLPPA